MNNALHDYRYRTEKAANGLESLANSLQRSPLELGDKTSIEALFSAAARLRRGRFRVLLLGCFSSGKSTLLNALLGQPVLPVKVNPCTAILTELRYSEEPSVELIFIDNRPNETISISDFTERFQLQGDEQIAGAEASDRFGQIERAVVGWPLPLLKDGVILLDSPGLDDDPARTARTLSSLPEVDAVIVVLSATRFLTELERRTLARDLMPLGLNNLFFPVTMVDLLQMLSDNPEADRRRLHQRGRDVLAPFCRSPEGDVFDQRFFLLDARGALHSRWNKQTKQVRNPVDSKALEESGLPPFERALTEFLVDERGQVQLAHVQAMMRRTEATIKRLYRLDQATAATSVEELKERYEELSPRLEQLDRIAKRVSHVADHWIGRQAVWIRQDLRGYVVEMENDLPVALAQMELGGLPQFTLLTPTGRKRIEDRLSTQLQDWLDDRMGAWRASLQPKLERRILELTTELAADANDFDRIRREIMAEFSSKNLVDVFPEEAFSEEDVAPAERWISVAMGALLLSPGTIAAGWNQGYEGAMKGAASRLGIRIAIVTIGALLGPIGWTGLVLYAISDALLLALTGGTQLKRFRAEVAQQLKGTLVAQVDSKQEELEQQVQQGLYPIRSALTDTATDEANEVRKDLTQLLAERMGAQASASDRAEHYNALLHQIQTILHSAFDADSTAN